MKAVLISLGLVLAATGCSKKNDKGAKDKGAPAKGATAKGAPAKGAPAKGATTNGTPARGALAPAAKPKGTTVADAAKGNLGTLTLDVPKTWKAEPTKNNMRRAQYVIPGDGGSVRLVVYYFGKGGAGNMRANLDRWIGQIKQPDGTPSKKVAKVQQVTVHGLDITTVDVSGKYTAMMSPGAAAGPHSDANSRLLAAIVVAPDGPYYFKLVGPAKTITAAKPAFDKMIASMKTATN